MEITPWIYPGVFLRFVKATDWSPQGPRNKESLTLNATARFACSGGPGERRYAWPLESTARNNLVTLTDGRHSICAVWSRSCNLKLDRDGSLPICTFELLDYDIFVTAKPPRNEQNACFGLILKGVVCHEVAPKPRAGKILSVSQQANVLTLLQQVQKLATRQLGQHDAGFIKSDPRFPFLFPKIPSTRHSREELGLVRSDFDATNSGPMSDLENPLSSLRQTSGESHGQNIPSEKERWDAITQGQGIPKYGSTPENTSRSQLKLLQNPNAWEPAPPGSAVPKCYIPSQDLTLLTDYADNPTKWQQKPGSANEHGLIAKRAQDRDQVGSSQPCSTNDSLVAHALAAKEAARANQTQGTTADSAQWSPSPPRPNAVAPERKSKDRSSPRSVEELGSDDSSEEDRMHPSPQSLIDNRPPPDTDDEAVSNHQPKSKEQSPASKRQISSRPSSSTQQQIMAHPQKEDTRIHTSPVRTILQTNKTDVGLIEGDADRSGNFQSFSSRKRGAKDNPHNSSLHGRESASLSSLRKARLLPESISSEDSDDSEIEIESPKAVRIKLPALSYIDANQSPQQGYVQVGRTPYSADKRLPRHTQSPAPNGTDGKHCNSDIIESPKVVAPNRSHVISIQKVTDKPITMQTNTTFLNADQHQQVDAELPSRSKQSLSRPEAQAKSKRKLSVTDTLANSDQKKPKMYKTRPVSPMISQSLLNIEQSTPAVDRARREHFQKSRDLLAIPSPAEVTRVTMESTQPHHNHALSSPRLDLSKNFSSSNGSSHNSSRRNLSKDNSTTTTLRSLKRLDSANISSQTQVHGGAVNGDRFKLSSSVSDFSDSSSSNMLQSAESQHHSTARFVETREPDPSKTGIILNKASRKKVGYQQDHRNEDTSKGVLHNAYGLDQVQGKSEFNSTSLYQRFQMAYPEYEGNSKSFLAICKKLVRLPPGFSVGKLFLDDFVRRYTEEYMPYSMECLNEAITPQRYEDWWDDNVDRAKSTKRVLSLRDVQDYVAGASSENHRTVISIAESATLAATEPFKRSAKPPIPDSFTSSPTKNDVLSPQLPLRTRPKEAESETRTGRFTPVYPKRSGEMRSKEHGRNQKSRSQYLAGSRNDTRKVRTVDLTQDESENHSESSAPRKKARRSLPFDTSLRPISPPRPPSSIARRTTSMTSNPIVKVRKQLTGDPSSYGNPRIASASSRLLDAPHIPFTKEAGIRKTTSINQSATSQPKVSKPSRPYREMLANYDPDPSLPFARFSKESAAIRRSAGNAFAREKGVQVNDRDRNDIQGLRHRKIDPSIFHMGERDSNA